MKKEHFILRSNPHPARANAVKAIWQSPDGYVVEIKEPTRTLEQNAKLHAMLGELVKSGHRWAGQKMSMDDWKALFTAVICRDQRTVPGIDGGIVVLGKRTSTMSSREIRDMIECLYAFGSDPDHLVNFKDMANVEPMGRTA